MRTVKHILANKSANIFSVNQNTSVYDALKTMMEKDVSALLIVEGQSLLGIFTERDYARKIILLGKSSKDTLIKDAMTANPLTITPDYTVEHCMALMTNKKFRHLPVTENNILVGMISIGDVVKFIIDEQQHTIVQLEHYITS